MDNPMIKKVNGRVCIATFSSGVMANIVLKTVKENISIMVHVVKKI
jgi:hypothetical protein